MLQKFLAFVLLANGLLLSAGTSLGSESVSALPTVARSDLSEFVRKVLEENPRLKAAKAAVESRSALREAADRPLYNPELFLDAENAADRTRAIGIAQSFDWANKRESRADVAESHWLSMQDKYLAERWSLSVELLTGLVRNQVSENRLGLAQQRQDLMVEFVELSRRRFSAGDLAQVELDLALLSLTDAQILKANTASQLAAAKQTVRSLATSFDPSSWPKLPTQFPAIPPVQTDTITQIEGLPWIRSLQRNIESASATVELKERERKPDPRLSLAVGTEDDESLVGLSLSIPLYIRNSFSSEVAAASADLLEAEQIYANAVQSALSQYNGAYERYRYTREAWQSWELAGQTSLSRQTELLRRLWEAGEISTTDYLVQLRQTLDVRENALSLWETLWVAWFEWLLASGQLDTWFTS